MRTKQTLSRPSSSVASSGRPASPLRAGVFAIVAALVLAVPVQASDSAAGALSTLPLPPDITPPTEDAVLDRQVFGRGRSLYVDMVRAEAKRQGLPQEVADAVVSVESAYNPNAVGGVGEVGLMQVRPTTAALLGFRGPVRGLFEPSTNVRYGVTYLAQAWRLTDGDLCETLMKYRAGHGESRMSALSVEYCIRARLHLAAIGSPLAQAPVPKAVEIGAVGRRLARARRKGGSVVAARPRYNARLWAAHNSRMTAIQSRVSSSALMIMR